MSASGSVRRFRARSVDVDDMRKVFAYACGQQMFCGLGIGKRFQAREMEIVPLPGGGLRKVYGTASECREQVGVEFVEPSAYSGSGVCARTSSVVRLKLNFETASVCIDDLCPTADLTYDEISDGWYGTIRFGGSDVLAELKCTKGSSAYDWTVRIFYGCPGLSVVSLPLFVTCDSPLTAGASWPIVIPPGCCGNALEGSTTVAVTVEGMTKARYVGRFTQVVPRFPSGRPIKVFTIGTCCPDPADCAPPSIACCGCDVNPNQWSFTVSGIVPKSGSTCLNCPDFNGTWTLTRAGVDVCEWYSTGAGVCTPGAPWRLICAGSVWRLSTTSFGGGATTYELAVGSWNCLGSNTLTQVGSHGSCEGFPGTIEVSPV